MARIGLPHLPRKLADYTGQPGPKYRMIYDAAVEGRIPAEFDGRWTVDEADLAAVATALGMKPAAAPKPARKAVPAPVPAAA